MTVTFSGDLSKTITSGQAEVKVKYGFITVFHKAVSVCEDPSLPCPIQAGTIAKKVDVAVPSDVPHGHYTGTATVTDQDGDQVTCIQVDVHIS